MKRLTELVHLREKLTMAYDPRPANNELIHLTEKIDSIVSERGAKDHQGLLDNLIRELKQVEEKLQSNRRSFDLLIDEVNRDILNEGTKFFSDNYDLEIKVESEAVSNIRKVRVMELSDELNAEILSRIRLYSTWQYPALEIGCRDGEWTKHLVASDPLYIVDHYREFTEKTVSQFAVPYQRRIRPYVIKEYDMSMLPQAQFGFIFCWNFLNYRSLDTVKEYLKTVKELLRPGGTCMFSYNNGDIPECAGYAEGFWMSYIPKSMLIPMVESLGFEVTYSRDVRGQGTSISWLEIRKHGSLETIKAHQALGEILSIP